MSIDHPGTSGTSATALGLVLVVALLASGPPLAPGKGPGSLGHSGILEGAEAWVTLRSAALSNATGTLTGVSVSPSVVSLDAGGWAAFTASPQCTGGPCPGGITYVWFLSEDLGTLNRTSGSVVNLTAGTTAGAFNLFANASAGTTTVESKGAVVQVTASSTPTSSSGGGAPPSLLWVYAGIALVAVAALVARVVYFRRRTPASRQGSAREKTGASPSTPEPAGEGRDEPSDG